MASLNLICGHCNELCNADGVKGEAFECDLCEGWFHAACGNILVASITNLFPSLQSLYQIWYIIVSTTVSITNQMYSCQILKSSVTESAQISDGVKDTNRDIEKSLSDLIVHTDKCIEDLGSKIENLSNLTGLQMEVDSIQSQSTSAGLVLLCNLVQLLHLLHPVPHIVS